MFLKVDLPEMVQVVAIAEVTDALTEAVVGRFHALVERMELRGSAASASGAEDAATARMLQKQLASEAQMGEIASGGREPFAGAGVMKATADVDWLVARYGGRAEDRAKVKSSSFTSRDGEAFQVHACRNNGTGQVVEQKTKLAGPDRRVKKPPPEALP